MKEIIQITNLTKDYGNGKGIFDVSLSVKKGEIYGFLGPNGAGKSTTIRHLMGFVKPQKGNCKILGKDCFKQAGEIQRDLGYLAGEIAFMEDMNGRQLLSFLSEMKGLKDTRKREDLLERFELDPSGKVRKMSKGMKQKIGIIAAFMADPQVIILDEPTSGLDPLMQNRFVELLLEEKKQGKTIMMSSHIFEEIEKTCDETAIIRQGRIIAIEDMESMTKKQQMEYVITFTSKEACAGFCKEYGLPVVKDATVTICREKDLNHLLAISSKYPIRNFDVRRQSLEELFMHYYGETAVGKNK